MSDSDAFWKGGCPRGCEFLSTPKAGSRLISIALGAAGHAQIFLPLGCCLSPKLSGNKEAVKDLSFRLPSCGTKADISCTRSSRLHSDNPSFADVVCHFLSAGGIHCNTGKSRVSMHKEDCHCTGEAGGRSNGTYSNKSTLSLWSSPSEGSPQTRGRQKGSV